MSEQEITNDQEVTADKDQQIVDQVVEETPEKTELKKAETLEVEAKEVEAKEVEANEVEAKEVEAKEVEAKEVGAKEVEAKEVEAKEVEPTKNEESEILTPEADAATAEAKESKSVEAEAEKAEEIPSEEPKETEPSVPESKNDLLAEKASEEPAPDDFDWDNFTADHDDYTAEERAKLEVVFDKTLSSVAEAEVIDGKVVFMNKREVVVNIGYKSEGVVSLNEFRYNSELAIGDTVEVFVETLEDRNGQLVLSHKKARALRSWDRVNQSYDSSEVIKGFIKCRTKGGMIVDVFGIEAFLPGSQIDVKPIRDYDMYVGKTMEFKVVKINQEFKNVVVSHKALIEAELEIQKQEIISKLEKGQVLEGTVKNITSYGVFIDLGGVDGLIHITDLSWGRVNHPEEIVQLDEKINVVILDFDDNKKRIALGLKQLTPHPWNSLDANLKVGDVVKGKVVVMADYGAFVEIASGVEGLIHVSEMSWSQHLRSAQEFLKVGDEVEAQILTLDREDRKMSLGIKQLREDPWSKIADKYTVGSNHTARIRNFTGFGVFVEIEEGVDGLIHISDLSWTKKIKHPAEFCAIGDEIEVVVLEIDSENRRLSLGHKQLEENPWNVFETLFSVGSIHEGTIVNIFDRGAVITLPYGVEGFATPRHLTKEDGTQAKADEKLQFKVIEFNKSAKRIILSHSRIFEDEKRSDKSVEKKARSQGAHKGMKQVKQSMESTTLGDISDLAKLKSQMEADELGTAKKKAAKMEATAEAKKAKLAQDKAAKQPVAEEEVKVKKETAAKKSTKAEKESETKTEKKPAAKKATKVKKEAGVEADAKPEKKPVAKKATKAKKETETEVEAKAETAKKPAAKKVTKVKKETEVKTDDAVEEKPKAKKVTKSVKEEKPENDAKKG
ncbi:MAG: 30S ribosomal protein S1 [Bacteroidales bacterium]|nr:30S ribosomal protein S1 [Bacteroidales bacterium]